MEYSMALQSMLNIRVRWEIIAQIAENLKQRLPAQMRKFLNLVTSKFAKNCTNKQANVEDISPFPQFDHEHHRCC